LTSISNINEYLLLIDNQYYLKIKDVDSFITMGFSPYLSKSMSVRKAMYRYKPYTNERFTLTIQKKDRVFPYSELYRFYTKKELRNKKINDLLTI
jgi:predicted glycosyl hydrolase (DUF1957 family)